MNPTKPNLRETLRRGIRPLVGTVSEFRGFTRVAGDRRSLLRFGLDILLYRVLALVRLSAADRMRSVKMQDGTRLVYRLNRGDIQAIREVWLQEIYRLPFDLHRTRMLLDLGAHIGLATVWLTRKYGFSHVVAVEPSMENARLARLNMHLNGVRGLVIEAAIAPGEGAIRFHDDANSQLGRVGSSGRVVRSLPPQQLLDQLRGHDVDLVKLDIEGAEGPLLANGASWLDRVHSLLVEFHPTHVDYPALAQQLEKSGFTWFPAGSVLPQTTDAFLRTERAHS